MAKSSRASVVKRNNQNLKRKVFGPVETARNERLNAKLLELAQQPKPLRAEMEVEQRMSTPYHSDAMRDSRAIGSDRPYDTEADATPSEANEDNEQATKDIDMEGDNAATQPTLRSNKSLKREKLDNKARVEKKRHRKTTNRIAFAKHPKKGKNGKR